MVERARRELLPAKAGRGQMGLQAGRAGKAPATEERARRTTKTKTMKR